METHEPAILVITDDATLAKPIVDALEVANLQSRVVQTALAAHQVSTDHGFLILATATGDLSVELYRDIRKSSAMPIILLAPDDRQLAGRDTGADHCLPSSANPHQLMAEVRAFLRKLERGERQRLRVLTFEGWRVDTHRRAVTAPDGSRVSLLAAEFDLLVAFCRSPGTVLSRRVLLEATHIGLGRPLERSVDVHVCRLRRKLAEAGDGGDLIQTVRLGGYVLVSPINPE
ncbi:response regulator transcription factor (plasmid) [Sinorhizobium sp. B11]